VTFGCGQVTDGPEANRRIAGERSCVERRHPLHHGWVIDFERPFGRLERGEARPDGALVAESTGAHGVESGDQPGDTLGTRRMFETDLCETHGVVWLVELAGEVRHRGADVADQCRVRGGGRETKRSG
jgi:hypothetical protein